MVNLRGRYYCGRIIQAEYSPVTDFREGRCRQYDEHNCSRGPYCNFLHLRPVPKFARRYLRRTRLKARRQYGTSDRSRRRRHKLRLPGMFGGVNGFGFNESSDESSFTDESDYERRWRTFPIRGNSQERRECIAQWNDMLDEKRNRKKKKKLEKMAKQQKDGQSNVLLNASISQLLSANAVNAALAVNANALSAVNAVAAQLNGNRGNTNPVAAAAALNLNSSMNSAATATLSVNSGKNGEQDLSMGIGSANAGLNLPANPPPTVNQEKTKETGNEGKFVCFCLFLL